MEQPQTFASIEQAALSLARDNKPSLDYHIKPYGDGYKAENTEQEFEVVFGQQSITFSSKKESANVWWSRLSLSAVGYGNKLRSVPGAVCEALDNRMSYKRGNVTEWYINMPIGIEQGFTLESCPGKSNGKSLVIEMAWSGTLTPVTTDNGSSLSLTSESGTKILRFGHLMTADATGRLLPSHFEQKRLKNGTSIVRIVVDDTDAVYPITIDPLAVQEAGVAASDNAANDYFGYSVSIFGETAVVGAYGKATNTGAAYVFTRNGGYWSEQQKLTASDGASGDYFGYSVDIDADTIVIGAYGDATSTGAAYVFYRTAGIWKQQQKLTASDKATGDDFGIAVSVYADTIVVGARGKATFTGAAYVFTRSGKKWSEQQKLTASDGAAQDRFGRAVDLDDDTIVIGANGKATFTGAAYIYFRTGTTWTEQQKLTATGGATNDYFGFALSLYANSVAIGAFGESSDRGSVYIFTRTGTTWTEQQELTATGGASGDKFGYAVALQGNAVLIGAPERNSLQGKVYLFVWDKITWKQKNEFAASIIANNDKFGTSVKFDGNTVFIGATGVATNTGLAYSFIVSPDAPTNTWAAFNSGTWGGDVINEEGMNARTGEMGQAASDIAVNTPMGPMALNRAYRQGKHSTYQFMGLGWTHGHYSKLTKITGSPNKIDVELPNGGELHFTETTTNHYVADPGSDAVADYISGWYDNNWTYRKKITFDNSAQAQNLVNFPVLVKLDSSRIDYSQTQNAGQDIRFTDSDGVTLLAHEIEKWDEAGTSYVWVKVPQVNASSSTDHIYMYYGNATAADGQQVTSVWDSNYKGVWHLSENPGGTAPQMLDSTSNNNDGTSSGSMTSADQVSGQIDGSLHFDGTNDAITVTDNSSLRPTNVTVEAWVKSYTATWNEYGWIVSQRTSTDGNGFLLYPNQGYTDIKVFVGINNVMYYAASGAISDITTWHHVVMSYASGSLVIYIDGVVSGSASASGDITYNGTSNYLTIGRNDPDYGGQGNRFGNGYIDEVRISSIARSSAWIVATYKSETDTFASYGTQESRYEAVKYVLTFGDKSTMVYNQYDLLSSRSWPRNETWTYTYTSGKLTDVDDGHGRKLKFAYISNPGQFDDGQLWQVGDHAATLGGTPSGRYIQFAYITQKGDGSDFGRSNTVKDDFNRANSASLGTNWGSYSGYANLDLYNNECRNPATDGTTAYAGNYYNVAQYGPDCEAYLTVTNRPTDQFLVAVRVGGTMSSPNNYGLECNYGGSGTMRLVRTDNGVKTALGTTFTQTLAVGASVGIRAVGSTITAYYKPSGGSWTILTSRTDTTYTSAGYLAVEAKTGGWRADNFGGGPSPKALLSTVRDVRGNTWTYDWYGQDTGETTAEILDHLLEVKSPSVDTTGDGAVDGSISMQKLTYRMDGPFLNTITVERGIQGTSSPLYSADYTFRAFGQNTTSKTVANKTSAVGFANGVASSFQDPLGNITKQSMGFAYKVDTTLDANGNLSRQMWTMDGKQLLRTIDSKNNMTIYRYNSGGASDGTIDSITDVEKRQLKFTYGDANNPLLPTMIKFYDTDGVTVLRWKEYTYDSNGHVLTEIQRSPDWNIQAQTTNTYYSSGDGVGLIQTSTQKDMVTGWYNSSWGYRRKIALDNTARGETLYNFPILIKLDSTRITYGQTQNLGQDIRFTTSDGVTLLAHEIEKWEETGPGISYVWVKLPQLTASSTDYIYMYYGNATAADGQQITSVWDANFKGVWHLKEDPSGSAPQMQDSTSNNNDGTSGGSMTSGDQVTGQIDGSLDFDGVNDYVISGPSKSGITNLTISMWFNPSGAQTTKGIFQWADALTSAAPWILLQKGTTATTVRWYVNGSYQITHTVSSGTWYHVTLTYDGTTWKSYLNGGTQVNYTGALGTYGGNNVYLGNGYNGYYSGQIDEVKISNVARSAAWAAATYQSESDTLASYAAEEAYASPVGNDQTTTFTYDAQGRLKKKNINSTFGSCLATFDVLDMAGNVIASICNYENAGAEPTTQQLAKDLFDPTKPTQNRVTTFDYDTLGRKVKTVTDAGTGSTYAKTTIIAYDHMGRVIRTIGNYVSNSSVTDPYVHNREDFTHGTDNNQNLVSDTAYNELGLVKSKTDILGNVTLPGYDDAGRAIRTVINASHPTYNNDYGCDGDPSLAKYSIIASPNPDQDIMSKVDYDAGGRAIRATDPLGNVSLVGYDSLSRVVKAVKNASQPKYDMVADPELADYKAATQNWYDSNWTYRRKVTFDNSAQAETLYHFPVLIKLDSSRINYSQTQNAGEDIRFTSSDGTTLLAHEIEKWDEAGTSYVWVRVPEIAASSAAGHIYMYYGNATAADGQNGTSVWHSNFKGVWHLKEDPSGSAPQMHDSTLSNNGGTSEGSMGSGNQVSGQINGSLHFDGIDDDINIATNFGFGIANITIEAWVNLSDTSESGAFVKIGASGGNGGIGIGVGSTTYDNEGNNIIALYESVRWINTSTAYGTGLHHVALVVNGSSVPSIYKDGVLVGSYGGANPINPVDSTTKIGGYTISGFNRRGVYDLDEVRIHGLGRSAAWIAASYKSQADTFASFGTEEEKSSNVLNSNWADQDIVVSTVYDSMGRVLRTQDVMGNWTIKVYDNLGRNNKTIINASRPTYDRDIDPTFTYYPISSAVDQDIVAETVYDVAERPMYTIDPMGRRTWVAYDGLGRNIRTIQNATGTATDGSIKDPRSLTYAYTTSSTDKDLIAIKEYDTSGRVARVRDPLGNWTLTGYDSVNRPVMVVKNASNPNYDYISDPTLSRYQPRAGATVDQDIFAKTQYDAEGRVSYQIDPAGNKTVMTYDAVGRNVKTVGNFVTGVFSDASPDQDLISTNTYDLAGRVTLSVAPCGARSAVTYDRAGRKLITTGHAGTPFEVKAYICYDKAGRVLRAIASYLPVPTDPSPDAKDSKGDWLFKPAGYGIANDTNLIVESTLDKLGRVTSATDLLGNVSSIAYYKDGKTESTTDVLGHVTKFRYDLLRRGKTVVKNWKDNSEPGLWVWDAVDGRWEDGSGNAITFGSANDHNIIVQTEFDKAGRTLAVRDPRGNRTTYEYNLLDQRTKTTNPLSKSWTTAYAYTGDGRAKVSVTDPLTFVTQTTSNRMGLPASISYLNESPKNTYDLVFSYDKLGSQLKMEEMDGATLKRSTAYTYDHARRMRQADYDTNGDGSVDKTLKYTYDSTGRRTQIVHPDGKTLSYTYNCAGQMTTLTDWASQLTRFTYDRTGRNVGTVHPSGIQEMVQYDAGGRLTEIRQSYKDKTLGYVKYTHDVLGQKMSAYEAIPHATGTGKTIAYDDASVEYYKGTWTAANPYETTTNIHAAMRVAFFGTSATLTMGTGPDQSTYDIYVDGDLFATADGYASAAGDGTFTISPATEGPHLVEIVNRREKNASSSGYKLRFKTLVMSGRQYDLQTTNYTYDGANRVSTAYIYAGTNTGGTAQRQYTYTFDVASNRTQKVEPVTGTTNYTYNAANQLATAGGITYKYDDAGRLTCDNWNGSSCSGTTYTWDRANRMLSVGTSSYKYDGAGNRVEQTSGGNTTQYVQDIQSSLSTIVTATTGTTVNRYIQRPGGLLAQSQQIGAGSETWSWV